MSYVCMCKRCSMYGGQCSRCSSMEALPAQLQTILQVHTEEEIQKILPIATKHEVPVTFRAAGTSLSGQALTDSVLLKLSHTGRNFRNYEIHVSTYT